MLILRLILMVEIVVKSLATPQSPRCLENIVESESADMEGKLLDDNNLVYKRSESRKVTELKGNWKKMKHRRQKKWLTNNLRLTTVNKMKIISANRNKIYNQINSNYSPSSIINQRSTSNNSELNEEKFTTDKLESIKYEFIKRLLSNSNLSDNSLNPDSINVTVGNDADIMTHIYDGKSSVIYNVLTLNDSDSPHTVINAPIYVNVVYNTQPVKFIVPKECTSSTAPPCTTCKMSDAKCIKDAPFFRRVHQNQDDEALLEKTEKPTKYTTLNTDTPGVKMDIISRFDIGINEITKVHSSVMPVPNVNFLKIHDATTNHLTVNEKAMQMEQKSSETHQFPTNNNLLTVPAETPTISTEVITSFSKSINTNDISFTGTESIETDKSVITTEVSSLATETIELNNSASTITECHTLIKTSTDDCIADLNATLNKESTALETTTECLPSPHSTTTCSVLTFSDTTKPTSTTFLTLPVTKQFTSPETGTATNYETLVKVLKELLLSQNHEQLNLTNTINEKLIQSLKGDNKTYNKNDKINYSLVHPKNYRDEEKFKVSTNSVKNYIQKQNTVSNVTGYIKIVNNIKEAARTLGHGDQSKHPDSTIKFIMLNQNDIKEPKKKFDHERNQNQKQDIPIIIYQNRNNDSLVKLIPFEQSTKIVTSKPKKKMVFTAVWEN